MKFNSTRRFYRFAMFSEIATFIRNFSKDTSFSVARFVSKPLPVPVRVRVTAPVRLQKTPSCQNGVCSVGDWKPTRPSSQPKPTFPSIATHPLPDMQPKAQSKE